MTAAPQTQSAFEAVLDQAWRGALPVADLFAATGALSGAGRDAQAAALYQTWLQRTASPHRHLVEFNHGVLLFSTGDYAGARAAYARALRLVPDFLEPRFNLGLTYERLGDSTAAVAQWQSIVANADAARPEQRALLLMALNNLGRHLEDQGQLGDALAALTRSLRLDPRQPDVIHHWVFLRAKTCQWPVYAPMPGLDEPTMRAATSAMAMISQSHDPQEQLAAARRYVASKVKLDVPRLAPAHPYEGHRRIRIGYCSGDLCLHPVAMLTAELFELHDRERFEVHAFDWSRDDGSPLRARVLGAMDHVHRIHHLDDEAAARLIRAQEIDILIDLQGQTLGARANMLAYRPAPIQITYLGQPATTGLPFIDYVVADRFLIPEAERAGYSEQPLYLPDVYQASDRQRQHAEPPTRAACGLPEHAFVFCSFNNNYKITPEVFERWMAILHRVPDSVLWLLADNPWARESLEREALARGIDPARLVFATRALPQDYLARYKLADLFLDCWPFNAGTTANDALWMGLPVLTLSGRTFAARMAGALLHAAGLDELITTRAADYEALAVRLAHDRAALDGLRARLAAERDGGVLFDTPRFVRHLEAALERVVDEARAPAGDRPSVAARAADAAAAHRDDAEALLPA